MRGEGAIIELRVSLQDLRDMINALFYAAPRTPVTKEGRERMRQLARRLVEFHGRIMEEERRRDRTRESGLRP